MEKEPQAPESTPAAPEEKQQKSWRNEEQVLPENRLGIVFLGLMATVFLAALDQVSYIYRGCLFRLLICMVLDYRLYGIAHNCREDWRWKRLWMGRQARSNHSCTCGS